MTGTPLPPELDAVARVGTALAEGRRLRHESADPALGDALELTGQLQLAPCEL